MKKIFAAVIICLFVAGCDDNPVLTDPGYTKPPILISPENGATNVELCPAFRWDLGGVYCSIEVADNPNFQPVLLSGGKWGSISDSLEFPDSLYRGGIFYWRARASYGEWGLSGWSVANRFRTIE